MARTAAELPAGSRITDYISLGVITRSVPRQVVDEVLAETGRASQRERELPAHVMVYYAIAMALWMQTSYQEVLRCLLEGLQWLAEPGAALKVTGKSGISQARTRLGSEPLRQLHDRLVRPIAQRKTKGAWYRRWRLVGLDGSTMAVADTEHNDAAFGRPGKRAGGKAAHPLLRFVSLVECGTHVLFSTRMDAYATGEYTIAQEVVTGLSKGMLCLADRLFFGFELWQVAQATGSDLLWRVKHNLFLPCEKQLADGSYLSTIYPSRTDRRRGRNGLAVRVIEYTLEGVPDADQIYRLVTTILDPAEAPAEELAALYPQRWEIEGALDELKTHLRGSQIVLRSKTPELVAQEFHGLMMAHFAIRGLMHEAALTVDEDPDRLSFVHTVRVLRRNLLKAETFSPSEDGSLP